MVLHRNRFLVPRHPGILKVAHQLLLLGVHTDDRHPLFFAALPMRSDMLELRVAVRAGARGNFLVIDLQGVFKLLEQSAHGLRAHINRQLLEFPRDLLRGFSSPLQLRHRIPRRFVRHQRFDLGDDFGRFFSTGLRPPPALRVRSSSTSWSHNCRRPRATVSSSSPSSRATLRSPP